MESTATGAASPYRPDDGLDYAEQHYSFIDKTRECALGASYGGYMADWVLGHTNRFKCIVTHDGMFNPESAYGTTEEAVVQRVGVQRQALGLLRQARRRESLPQVVADALRQELQDAHARHSQPARLPAGCERGLPALHTLQLLKVPSKMLYFPDEGHWVLKPQNSQLWYKTVNDWVDQWTSKAGNRE